MRIAVIGAKGLPAKQGGIEHHCEEIYSRLAAQGHEIDLYARSSYTGADSLRTDWHQGVRVISLPTLSGKKGFDAFISSALGAVAAVGTRYDIIHFHALGPSLFSWVSRLGSSAKVVATCHGLDWQRAKWSDRDRRILQYGERAAVRFAHRLIVVSEDLRHYFQQTYGKESVYIPNAPSSFGPSDPHYHHVRFLGLTPKRYILFLGRLVPEKCPDLLLKAFQKLELEGWKLVFVGGTSDTQQYTQELQQAAANNPNVVFTGELKGPHLAEIVRGAGLFVLPSELEGLPLALLEAMQEGIPVLASNIPVHQQLLKGDSPIGTLRDPACATLRDRGLLFPVGDVEACAQSLQWAVQNPYALANFAHHAQTYVRDHYNWEQITAETLQLYQSLCSTEQGTVVKSSPAKIPEIHRIPVVSSAIRSREIC